MRSMAPLSPLIMTSLQSIAQYLAPRGAQGHFSLLSHLDTARRASVDVLYDAGTPRQRCRGRQLIDRRPCGTLWPALPLLLLLLCWRTALGCGLRRVPLRPFVCLRRCRATCCLPGLIGQTLQGGAEHRR